ncbi:MAG: hypothetical protein LKG16_06835, partial [Bifidobacterium subtile]|nr:hypothetical protein [Bifidobacterium subtile]MCI1258918.1 hypothetical protein [Bifidobacterium subtile]
DDLPDGHALREIQVNGPAPILHRKHADSNPDAKTSNFSSAPPLVVYSAVFSSIQRLTQVHVRFGLHEILGI